MSAGWYTFITTITCYWRAFKVGAREQKHMLRIFLTMFILTFGILTVLICLKPLAGILVFLIPMLISLFVTSYVTYDHHTGLDTQNPFEACRNITSVWYNRLTGNLGYHTAHHLRCGVHWSLLPKIHESIKDQIPSFCYMKPSFFFRTLDYLNR